MEIPHVPHNYQVGQVWSYRTRPQDHGSTLTVLRIDSGSVLGDIFHISLDGLAVKNPRAPGGVTTSMPHLPMSREAMDMSVVQLLRTDEVLPDYREGYREWHDAFTAQKAGIFSIAAQECVEILEQAAIAAASTQAAPLDSTSVNPYDQFLAGETERLMNQPREFPDQAPNDIFGELSASLARAYKLGVVQSLDIVFGYCRRNNVDIPLPPHVSPPEKAPAARRKWWHFWR